MTDGATRARNKFDDIFSRFDTIHECGRETDRQRDGHRPRPRVKCELRKCEWVFCELKCEPNMRVPR